MPAPLFKHLSFYIIPNKDLCGHLTVLRLDPVLVYMGLSVEILNNKKYVRRSHQFNFGLIATEGEYSQAERRKVYEQLIRKIAGFLTVMEVDHDMLWDQHKKR